MNQEGIGTPSVQELSPGVFAVVKLVHFFAHIGVNAGIIHTPKSVVFVDSGMSAYAGRYLWNLAEPSLSGNEEIYLILTHKDSDHCFGMNEIYNHGATVISHEHTAKILREDGDIDKHPIALRIRDEYEGDVMGPVSLRVPDRTISGDIILDIGEELHILHVPGHTPGDIAVYHPRSKILFTGDAVLADMDPYIRRDSINLRKWISSLERLQELDVSWVVPGHGSISRPELIESNIRWLKKNLC